MSLGSEGGVSMSLGSVGSSATGAATMERTLRERTVVVGDEVSTESRSLKSYSFAGFMTLRKERLLSSNHFVPLMRLAMR